MSVDRKGRYDIYGSGMSLLLDKWSMVREWKVGSGKKKLWLSEVWGLYCRNCFWYVCLFVVI